MDDLSHRTVAGEHHVYLEFSALGRNYGVCTGSDWIRAGSLRPGNRWAPDDHKQSDDCTGAHTRLLSPSLLVPTHLLLNLGLELRHRLPHLRGARTVRVSLHVDFVLYERQLGLILCRQPLP